MWGIGPLSRACVHGTHGGAAPVLTWRAPPTLQMFYDDLPIWGFIGKVEKIMTQSSKAWEKHDLKYYLFTHIHFDILYNGDRVIEVVYVMQQASNTF